MVFDKNMYKKHASKYTQKYALWSVESLERDIEAFIEIHKLGERAGAKFHTLVTMAVVKDLTKQGLLRSKPERQTTSG
jgi:hypothetical protein